MWRFKNCDHPAKYLHVRKDHTIEKFHDHSVIRYHLYCQNCDKNIEVKYAALNIEQLEHDFRLESKIKQQEKNYVV